MRRRRALLLAPALWIAALSGRAAPAGDWPLFRGDALRTGNPERAELPRDLGVAWIFRGEGFAAPSFDSSPAAADGRVYLGVAERSVFSPGGRVVALDAASGELRWERKTRVPVFSSPVVAGGRVFVGEGYHEDSRCRLYCFDAASGEEVWTFRTKSHVESSAHVDKGRVYFGAGGDGIYCLSADDGAEVWHFEDEHVDISPLVSSGMVFAGTGYGEHAVFCLSAADGKLRWRTPVDLPVWGSPVLLGNRLCVGLGNGTLVRSDAEKPRGAVVCVAATSGKQVWRRDVPDAVLTAIAFAQGKVFFGSRDGHLYALDASSGEVAWKRSLGSPVVSSPVAGERAVAAVSDSGRLVVASIENGEELARLELAGALGRSGAAVLASPCIASGGRLVIGARDGGVIAIGGGKSDGGGAAR